MDRSKEHFFSPETEPNFPRVPVKLVYEGQEARDYWNAVVSTDFYRRLKASFPKQQVGEILRERLGAEAVSLLAAGVGKSEMLDIPLVRELLGHISIHELDVHELSHADAERETKKFLANFPEIQAIKPYSGNFETLKLPEARVVDGHELRWVIEQSGGSFNNSAEDSQVEHDATTLPPGTIKIFDFTLAMDQDPRITGPGWASPKELGWYEDSFARYLKSKGLSDKGVEIRKQVVSFGPGGANKRILILGSADSCPKIEVFRFNRYQKDKDKPSYVARLYEQKGFKILKELEVTEPLRYAVLIVEKL